MEVDTQEEATNNATENEPNKVQLGNASLPEVMEKYKAAGIVANRAMHLVLSSCKPGVKIVDLCRMGDEFIVQELEKVYQDLNKKGQKGICFPTCVSVNEIAGHNSPFNDDKRTLHFGDMVKVDLGVHIDGFCGVIAHTIVLGPCKGKKADVIAAAWSAAQSALRLLKIGNKNAQVTLAIEKSASTFKAEPMDSVLSHEMRQYVIDHDNTIISKETPERKVAEFEFAEHQVFGIDIMMSSGRGKAVDRGEKCTVYKRNVEIEYPLKMKTSRELLKSINKQYPTFPFTMRNFEENRSRLGITECVRNNMVQPYPVLSEKHGEYVAQFKFTAVLNPKATIQITGLPLDMASVHPTHQIQDTELNGLLATKFAGVLPQFYEPVQLAKLDPSLMQNEEKQSKSNKASNTAQKKKPRPSQQKNKGKQKNQKQSNKKNQSQNKRKNAQSNKNSSSAKKPNASKPKPQMDLD